MKTAVVTGAGSGIGKAFAEKLSENGYKVVLVGRNEQALELLASELSDAEVFCADLGVSENCIKLFETYHDADMVINCAGSGVAGEFWNNELEAQLAMLDINIRAVHILTRLYTEAFVKSGSGCILNVASSAAFFPGPLFASYYASKSYVYRLTTSVHDELKHKGSEVLVSVVCPGPVDTEFNRKAGVKVGKGAVSADFVAEVALKNLGKRVIIPGFGIKCTAVLSKIVPEWLMSRINYRLQKQKQK